MVTMQVDDDTCQFLRKCWAIVASIDGVFQFEPSIEMDLIRIMVDMEGIGIEIEESINLQSTMNVERAWIFQVVSEDHSVAPSEAYIYQAKEQVWLDVSGLRKVRGSATGGLIYQAVANYAYNNNVVFIGDPAGLSDSAMSRRLEHMICTALKFDTTRHIKPHPDQLMGNADVPSFSWTDNQQNNLSGMLLAAYSYVTRTAPFVQNIRYNPYNGSYEENLNGSFQTLSTERFSALAFSAGINWTTETINDNGGGERPTTAGRRTIERTILTSTFLRTQSSKRPELLDALSRVQTEFPLGLVDLLY